MGEKKRTINITAYILLVSLYTSFKKVHLSKTCLPVQHVIVIQILCSPATLHIFNHMILQKLLQELHCLLSGDIRSKVAVATEQLVQPIHSCRGGEAGGVVPEVLPVFPEGHSSPKETSDFIPLKKTDSLVQNNHSSKMAGYHTFQINLSSNSM